jgi:hypothetical protein
MDPQAAWNEMLEAVIQRDRDQAQERADGLLEWMRNGGFPPQTTAVAMRPQWNRTMAEFGCLMVLQLVKKAQRRKHKRG